MIAIQFLLFFVYAALIIVIAKYMMMYFIRKISYAFQLSTGTTGKIIGYATSTPELIGSVAAASVGMIATSIFNILSSNIINVFLFLSAAIYYKKQKDLYKKEYLDEYIITAITILLPIAILVIGVQTHWSLIPLLGLLFFVYLFVDKSFNSVNVNDKDNTKKNKLLEKSKDKNPKDFKKITFYFGMLVLSILILYILGNRLGNVLETLGANFGIPELLLGILMGVITSLPELTSFFCSFSYYKEDNEEAGDKATLEALNNLTSSNASNLFLIQTIALLVFLLTQ